MVESFAKNRTLFYGSDQNFLQVVYDHFKDDKYTHDEFFEKKPFPIKRKNGCFVGERINQYDKKVGNDWKAVYKQNIFVRVFKRIKRIIKINS